MRTIYFLVFVFLSIPVRAIDFKQCIDKEGVIHYSNITVNSGANCKQTSYIDSQLEEDYAQLNQNYAALRNEIEQEPVTELDTEVNGSAISDLFDPDTALDQLLNNSRDAEPNAATKAFKARSNAVETILDQD